MPLLHVVMGKEGYTTRQVHYSCQQNWPQIFIAWSCLWKSRLWIFVRVWSIILVDCATEKIIYSLTHTFTLPQLEGLSLKLALLSFICNPPSFFGCIYISATSSFSTECWIRFGLSRYGTVLWTLEKMLEGRCF